MYKYTPIATPYTPRYRKKKRKPCHFYTFSSSTQWKGRKPCFATTILHPGSRIITITCNHWFYSLQFHFAILLSAYWGYHSTKNTNTSSVPDFCGSFGFPGSEKPIINLKPLIFRRLHNKPCRLIGNRRNDMLWLR